MKAGTWDLDNWEKTARLWLRSDWGKPDAHGKYWLLGVGIVRQASRWTRVGDVLLVASYNGDDRWSFTGVSSKGRRLVGYYQTVRPRKKGGRIEIFEFPRELENLSPLDAAVRLHVDSLRIGNVAALQ